MGASKNIKKDIQNGCIREVDGKICIYYDGYWIRYYAPPPDTLAEKRQLIYSLQRRVFHHTENGINSPGWRLDTARKYYNQEQEPSRKRVNAAMLAGSLFNRATDIFSHIVEMEEKGIHIDDQNELMLQCERCFMEALELGKQVKHFSGEEGVDELWGEPFKAFSMSMEQFFESRYTKLAQTFRAIDEIIEKMKSVFCEIKGFEDVIPILDELKEISKIEAETMRRDVVIFEVWPRYVAAKETVQDYQPNELYKKKEDIRFWEDGLRLLHMGNEVIDYLAGVRVPMPVTMKNFINNCNLYQQTGSLDCEFSIPDRSARKE